jgi:GNAT superfamily N-acetyltransferase
VSNLDDLAEAARNRGLKLVRSRVRTPGKRRFGKVGLADASGKPVFGMDAKGPTARPEEVEEHLRTLGANDWGASLGAADRPKSQRAKRRVAANDRQPAPKPVPPPPKPNPKLSIREAKSGDARALAELVNGLGHPMDEKTIRKNLAALGKLGEIALVAVEDKAVVGLVGVHKMVAIHRDAPVGRIPILVVAETARGKGIGKMLVEAAEEFFRKAGCRLVEVTSNDRLPQAHAFYRHMGYERTSIRFAKTL